MTSRTALKLLAGVSLLLTNVVSASPVQSRSIPGERVREKIVLKTVEQRSLLRDRAVKRDAETREKERLTKRKLRRQERFSERERNYKTIEVWVPYWEIRGETTSTLVINNAQGRVMTLQPLVFDDRGRRHDAKAIRLPENASLDIPLASLIEGAQGRGHIGLRYYGESLEVNAEIVIGNNRRSLAFHRAFEQRESYTASRFEGLFYAPSSETNAEIAITNFSNRDVDVALAVQMAGKPGDTVDSKRAGPDRPVKLKPHQTEVVNVRRFLGDARHPSAVGVIVTHDGAPGDVLVHGMVSDPRGFSANMRIRESTALGSAKLISPVLPLAELLQSIVLLSNTNSADMGVHLEAYFTLEDEVEEKYLTTVTVPAGEVQYVDVTTLLQSLPPGATNVGLFLNHYAHGGGLLADVLLIDSSGSGVYQVSPKGYAGDDHKGHSFAFRIDGTMETIVTVANPSETEDRIFHLMLHYEGGTYTYAETTLRPGEIQHVDIKGLRDDQTPGQGERLLPKTLSRGQVKVYFRSMKTDAAGSSHAEHEGHGGYGHGGGGGGISGATMFDTAGKVSMTTCQPGPPLEIVDIEVGGPITGQFISGVPDGKWFTIWYIWDDYSETEAEGGEINGFSYSSGDTGVAEIDSEPFIAINGPGVSLIEIETGSFYYDNTLYGSFYDSCLALVWEITYGTVDLAAGEIAFTIDGPDEIYYYLTAHATGQAAFYLDWGLIQPGIYLATFYPGILPAGTYSAVFISSEEAEKGAATTFQAVPTIRVSNTPDCSAQNAQVTRGSNLTLVLDHGPANPVANPIDWEFSVGPVQAQTTTQFWGGSWVLGGTVTAEYDDAAGHHATPVGCAVTVNARTGAGWAATPNPAASLVPGYVFQNFTWLASWNNAVSPVTGRAVEDYGTVTTPNTTASRLGAGPNTGYSYYTAASLAFSNYRWVWARHPDIENVNSPFAKCQTGAVIPGVGTIISIANLRNGIQRHESSTVSDSHLADFIDANSDAGFNLMRRMEGYVELIDLQTFNGDTAGRITTWIGELNLEVFANYPEPLNAHHDNSTNPPTYMGGLHIPNGGGVYPYACNP